MIQLIGSTLLLLISPLAAHWNHSAGPDKASDPVLKFTIPEHDLYPENIAYDSVSKSYFLSSMARSRILRIRENGSYDDFVSMPGSNLLSSVGMKVDAKRRRLWVCSGRFTLFRDHADAPARTGVLLFDIDEGRLIKEWHLPQESDYHIFNDISLTADGDAYATTTLIGRIYRLSADAEEMELVHQLEEGRHNNGIDLDPSGRFIFVTVDRSISRLEPATGKLVEMRVPGEAALGSDGLYFYENSLIVVKPRFKEVSRLFLNQDMTAVERVVILAKDHPDFAYPTTGAVVGDRLLLVSTSFADVPRNPAKKKQHGDIKIHQLMLTNR
jgi:hypothetical protein